MSKTIQTKIILALVAIAFFGTAFAVAEASHKWSKYHWDKSTAESTINPLKLGDNLTTVAWRSSLAGASTDWNQSVLKNQVVSGTSNSDCDPTLGQVEVCNAEYGDNDWLGIAQIWIYRGPGHIAQGLVKVNDTYYNTAKYNTSPWRNLVMCQEVGHTLGLGHQDEDFYNTNLGTCMDYTSDPDGTILEQLNNERPNQHDYDMMAEIYGHLNDKTTTDGGGKPDKGNNGKGGGKKNNVEVGADIDLNDPSSWGQAIKQDAQGNNSLYVRNLGNGMELITHVIWVE